MRGPLVAPCRHVVAFLGHHAHDSIPLNCGAVVRREVRNVVLLPTGHARPQGAHFHRGHGQDNGRPTKGRGGPIHHEEWPAVVGRRAGASA